MKHQSLWLHLVLLVGILLGTVSCGRDQEDSCPTCPPSTGGRLQLLIPLYIYPNSDWDRVAAAAARVKITAIINPNIGPGGGPPNSDYQRGIATLRNAGVIIIGYIPTGYGERDIQAVKADVDLYNQYFNIHGIFFDEAANNAGKHGYYETLYTYVKSLSNLDAVFLNPGTSFPESYLTVCDTIVMFEGYGDDWPAYQLDAFVRTYPSERFAALVHTAPDTATMRTSIDIAIARNVGYMYVTDDILPNPWDTLPGFWEEEMRYVE
jgi:hypothetical protein